MTSILNADHLEEQTINLPTDLERWEDEQEMLWGSAVDGGYVPPELLLPTLADAQRAAARLAKLRRTMDEFASLYDEEEKRLLAEVEANRQRKAMALKPYERRSSWYVMALEQFHRAQLAADPRAKTIRLPAGDLTARAQQPEWTFVNEESVKEFLRGTLPDAVRTVYQVDKRVLKDSTTVQPDGTVAVKATGEVIPGITVAKRPPKFDFKPA